jgi:MFS family permease
VSDAPEIPKGAARGFWHDLRVVMRRPHYRQLLAAALTSRLGDGFLFAAAGTYVLFDPNRHATAAGYALAFTVIYLPYSLIGPFAGIALDRWQRRQVLLVSSVLRACMVALLAALLVGGTTDLVFAVLMLTAFGLNRFFLAGIGASIPRVVPGDELVMANAVTPTIGTLFFSAGGLMAVVLRQAAGGSGPGDAAVVAACAGCFVLVARTQLGPDSTENLPQVSSAVATVLLALIGAVRHLRERFPAGWALLVMASHRFAFGFVVAQTVVLFRNTFFPPDEVDAALAGIAGSTLALAGGIGLAVLLTPIATRRMTKEVWMVLLLELGALGMLLPAATIAVWTVMIAGVVLGLSSQGVKICVDSLVQQWSADDVRGRAFSIYDMMFQMALVASAITAALVLPPDGASRLGFLAAGLLMAVIGLVYRNATTSSRYRAMRAPVASGARASGSPGPADR